MSRLFALALGASLLLVRPPLARADTQEDKAAALDREAREAFKQGDFARAGERFDESNRLAPHAELRYNAALAWEKAHEPARAADAYEGALRQGGLDETRGKKARAALAGLKETLGYVKLSAPVGGVVSVAHLSRAPIPAQFHLAPGEYSLGVERPDGSSTTKSISVRAGEVQNVEIETDTSTPAATPKTIGASPRPAPVEPTPELDHGSSSKTTVGVILLGAGVGFAGAAAYFGTQTLKASSDYENSHFTDASARDRGVRDRTITNVALAGAALGIGFGSYFLLSAPKSSSSGAAPRTLRVGFSGPSVSAELRF